MTSRSDDRHGKREGPVESPASLDPVTLKAPSGHSPLSPTRGVVWTRPSSMDRASPRVDPKPDQGVVIRGGAAADRDLDEMLSRERGPRDRTGAVLVERYRIVREIGTGSGGTVYLAEDRQTKSYVAVKILHRELHFLPEMVARFKREALAASRIDHPNVAGATDFGTLDDGACFLVLELIEGMSLSEVLSREGALAPRRALHIARQVAAGLGAAHRAGIIHRDLKPDNVMLMHEAPEVDTVKVVDFGIAHVPAEEGAQLPLTQRGSISGTPDYMAPEQAAGTIVDHRADLYTLGIVLYEMLSGRTPFRGDDMQTVLDLQMTAMPAPLPTTVDPGVARLVRQLLAKDPDLRPPTAEEVWRRIGALLDSEGATGAVSSRDQPFTPSPMSAPVSSRPANAFPEDPDSAPASVRSPPASSGTLRLGRTEVPAWTLVLATAIPLAIVVIIVALGAGKSASDTAPSSSASELSVDQLDALAHRAARGNLAALQRLERHPPTTAAQWAAIGRGHAGMNACVRSAVAYSHALRLDPKLRHDETLLRDLHRASGVAPARALVLEIAVTQLGEHGPDLIYDVWSNAESDHESAALARRTSQLLHELEVREASSPALRIAVDLWDGRTCEEYRKLLPRAREHADRRSAPVLRTLTREKGCGEDQQQDCFPCLRGNDALSEALESAEKRMPPRL